MNGVHNNKADGGSYTPDDGICWWTNGFWAGMLWQAYHATHDDRYAEIARYTERRLDEAFNIYLGCTMMSALCGCPAPWRTTA